MSAAVFPIKGAATYRNDWGDARSGGREHRGNDLFAPMGTPVVAVQSGTITAAGDDGGKGGLAIWLVGTWYYAHLSKLAPGIKSGATVRAGQVIGFVGDSGNAKGGSPHLHFGYDPNGRQSAGGSWANPYDMLKAWEAGTEPAPSQPEPPTLEQPQQPAVVDAQDEPLPILGPDAPPVETPLMELPGSAEIPYQPSPADRVDLWLTVASTAQSEETRRWLDRAQLLTGEAP